MKVAVEGGKTVAVMHPGRDAHPSLGPSIHAPVFPVESRKATEPARLCLLLCKGQ